MTGGAQDNLINKIASYLHYIYIFTFKVLLRTITVTYMQCSSKEFGIQTLKVQISSTNVASHCIHVGRVSLCIIQ